MYMYVEWLVVALWVQNSQETLLVCYLLACNDKCLITSKNIVILVIADLSCKMVFIHILSKDLPQTSLSDGKSNMS